MKLGLFLNTQSLPGEDAASRLPEMVAQVRTARECGFSSLWLPYHYLTAPMQMFHTSTMLAHLVSEAKGMTIGGDIMILPLLNPVSVAEETATLDLLSGGNYVLGVGIGYRPEEYEAFGIPLSERVPRFTESVALIRRLWTEDRVTHHGRFFSVTDAGIGAKPVRKEGVPIWIGAYADAAIKRAAAIGDAWLIAPSTPFDELVPAVKLYRDELRRLGKPEPSEFPLTRECYVGTSQATALAECRASLQFKYDAYSQWGLDGHSNEDSAAAFEKLVRDCFIIGDKAFVKEEIARYRETLGINHFIMRVHWPGLPHQLSLRSIRALAEIFA